MQENGYINKEKFNKWMDYLINYYKVFGNLKPSKRLLLILDGHKDHISIEILKKHKNWNRYVESSFAYLI